jgi:hypothetical protein
MSTRFTYTSGALGSGETNAEFESELARARDGTPAEPLPHLIDGQAVATGEPFERRDPSSDGTPASRAHVAGPDVVARAVEAARAAAPGWGATPFPEPRSGGQRGQRGPLRGGCRGRAP